jgi:hypothetical protein
MTPVENAKAILQRPVPYFAVALVIILISLAKNTWTWKSIAATLAIAVVVYNVVVFVFGLNIVSHVRRFIDGRTELDVVIHNDRLDALDAPVPEILAAKQVFHVTENNLGYNDAQAVCQAYGGRLANYGEVEASYKAGAEWCGYGWSADQMALYPTQQKTWDELQKIEGHEHDCGRPGVNGGYMANPQLKFGANCYGYKPRMTHEEELRMQNTPLYPKTAADIAIDHRVDYWKQKLQDVLVSPFNPKRWSRV